MTLDSLAYKLMHADGGRGLYARISGDNFTTSAITPMTKLDACWLIATLIHDAAVRAEMTPRSILKDISQAVYLLETHRDKIEYKEE